MSELNPSKVRMLVPEQSRKLLEAHARILEATMSIEAPRKAIGLIAEIVDTRVALLGTEAGEWTGLADSGYGPSLPELTGVMRSTLDRVGDAATVMLERWTPGEEDWTLVGLTRRAGAPAVLIFYGDWTPSAPSLLQLGHNLLLAECAYALATSAQVRLATHRLSRALARTTGVRSVSEVAVRSAAKAVHAQIAALAVANADGQALAITATHGYPLTLVEHLRIRRGEGVLGSVFESGLPLRVSDVSRAQGARRRRSRYKTNSFAVVPISAGQDILGAV